MPTRVGACAGAGALSSSSSSSSSSSAALAPEREHNKRAAPDYTLGPPASAKRVLSFLNSWSRTV
ncbi:MAG: hypothetical protein ABL908_14905, partial [Hyphomicrobium sp.]